MKRSGIVIVILVGLLGLGLLAAGCGQKSTTKSGTPKEVVTAWLNDLKNGNWGAAYDALSSADKKKVTLKQWIDTYSKQGKPPAGTAYTVTDEKITGNNATVTVRATLGSQSQNATIPLIKEGNSWKVSASTAAQTQ